MNKAMRLVWLMCGGFVLLALAAYLVFWLIGFEHKPDCFVFIPLFFILLALILGLIVRKYAKDKKELSVGGILGIRTLFIAIITVVLIANMLLDRAHVLPLALIYALFTVKFSILETKILLILTKKSY